MLKFGQPAESIVQFAYTTADARKAAHDWTRLTGIGPWFFRGPFHTTRATYRGEQATHKLLVAQAFSGHTMIELIEQQDDSPSIYREYFQKQGHGFHHIARATRRFEEMVHTYKQSGLKPVYESILPTDARLKYFDLGSSQVPGFIEIVEMTPSQERVYANVYDASINWDGRNPHRSH